MFFKLRSTSLLAATLLALGIASGVQAQGKYVLISHAPDSDSWWNTIKNGLKQASEDHGVTVYYRNPAKSQKPKAKAKAYREAIASNSKTKTRYQ